jgi:hypothetical protein
VKQSNQRSRQGICDACSHDFGLFGHPLADPPAVAEDCQALAFEAREALLRKAPTCDKAKELLGGCTAGGSGDISLGQIVTEKRQAAFLQKLSTEQRRSYDREMKSCNDEYKEGEGTLSRAMAAGCRADLAQSYAHKFGKRQR